MAKSFIDNRILQKFKKDGTHINFPYGGEDNLCRVIDIQIDRVVLVRVASARMGDPYTSFLPRMEGIQYYSIMDSNQLDCIKEYKQHRYNTKLGKVLYK